MKYELNQWSRSGPIQGDLRGIPFRDQVVLFLLFIVIFIITSITVYYNLIILYRSNPGYGRNIEVEQAFCEELNQTFINSHYIFDETDLVCKPIEVEVNAN
jgi:hypothetical protein